MSAECDGYVHCSDESDETKCGRSNLPAGIRFQDMFILQVGVHIPKELWRRSYQSQNSGHYSRLGTDIECVAECLAQEDFKCRSVVFATSLDFGYCAWLNDTLATLDLYESPPHNTRYDLFTLIKASVCSLPMGLERGVLSDTQISSSSFQDISHGHEYGRLRNASYWRPAEDDYDQWLQVSFERLAMLTGIVIQGSGNDSEGWVKRFNLSFTRDERAQFIWNTYVKRMNGDQQTILPGNSEPHCESLITLDPPIHAVHIRIHPTDWARSIGMRVELLGCYDNACEETSGLTSETILGSQITASSAYDTNYAPKNARLDTLGRRRLGWVASEVDTNPWIQINLQDPFMLRSVWTQGCQDADYWTTEYVLQYWGHEASWQNYFNGSTGERKIFLANNDRDSIVENGIIPEISTSQVRVAPISWHGLPALRLELIGCYQKVCDSRLGMQSGSISDSQISVDGRGFCTTDSMFRLFNESHVINIMGVGVGNIIDTTQYVEVDLLELHTITGIIIQGTAYMDHVRFWIQRFMIHFVRMDGNWITYKEIDGSNKVRILVSVL
ncbi:lactadherin-like [Amphiura filiformis]|uniref:lactadherin-like n=1 Tax=Amphiura filiformis TaxID=82378 RepID=UPI003B21C335